MNIAISQRVIKKDKATDYDALEQDYAEYYGRFGITLVPVPNKTGDAGKFIEGLGIKGIILSGGNDVNPELYGQKAEKEKDVAPARDVMEGKLLEIAAQKNIPVLCECRGMQFLNVHFGGSIVRRALEEGRTAMRHVGTMHEVEIVDAAAAKYLGMGKAEVNSYHNNCISKEGLAKPLRIFAQSRDGMVEGAYHPKLPFAAVLWHPERKPHESKINRMLVDAFVRRELFWQ
ncbi:GMP synthase [glutamine-hydrolyzing] subunit A [Candidatus Anstonella stagnisolia]|nr:GMP synthase [glutamine-hydrolyzing] subunit A [Candidatus Anstonella stagnisolia]